MAVWIWPAFALASPVRSISPSGPLMMICGVYVMRLARQDVFNNIDANVKVWLSKVLLFR
jgi:hypothetical protein